MNWFAVSIIVLFFLASIHPALSGDWARAGFYICSALINLFVVFMK